MISLEVRDAAVRAYSEHALDAIPLRPGTKKPLACDWPKKAPGEQWRDAPYGANVGVRCGGRRNVAVIDCDESVRPGTVANVRQFLRGLGLGRGDYPEVQTASGVGRHIFISVPDPPPGHARNISSELGAGEFRYGPAAYVVAPPSVVESSQYRRLIGDWRRLPTLTANDMRPLLPEEPSVQPSPQTKSSAETSIPRRTLCLLEGNADRPYSSRSEHEQAILVGLVNAGFSFGEALDLFLQYPAAGKFRELYDDNPANAERWFRLSWNNAQGWATTHESEGRKRARQAIEWAASRPNGWPGRAGPSDRAVFEAHARIAYRAGAIQYAASVRTLAEIAGVHRDTASRANRRLQGQGLIKLVARSVGRDANEYRLLGGQNHDTSTPAAPCVEVSALRPLYDHDAFRHGALNKSGAEIWAALQPGPMTVAELEDQTGRHPKTVRRTLRRMTRLLDMETGQIIDMVYKDGDHWRALPYVDLDQVARIMGSAGEGERQRRSHERERDTYHDYLDGQSR